MSLPSAKRQKAQGSKGFWCRHGGSSDCDLSKLFITVACVYKDDLCRHFFKCKWKLWGRTLELSPTLTHLQWERDHKKQCMGAYQVFLVPRFLEPRLNIINIFCSPAVDPKGQTPRQHRRGPVRHVHQEEGPSHRPGHRGAHLSPEGNTGRKHQYCHYNYVHKYINESKEGHRRN